MKYFEHALAVVIPTRGRPTLERALTSLKPSNQNMYGAETIVVYDVNGPVPEGYLDETELRSLCARLGVTLFTHDTGYSDWGYHQIGYGYNNINFSEYIMNIGDDDEMVSGIIPKMMKIINQNGIHPYLFQAELYPSPNRGNIVPITLWNDEDRSIERQKVTGQNLVIPNIPHLFGQMTDDFEFIKHTIARWHGIVQWIPLVTCRCY